MFTGSPVALAWGALFSVLLVTGCVIDLRERRIPNVLVLAILVCGFVFTATMNQVVPGLARGAQGVAVGFSIWIGFHVVGVLGAGDVKFFSAVGAWLGPGLTWRAALMAAVAGGVLAVVYLLRQRRLGQGLRGLALAASTRSLDVVRGDLPAPGRVELPYGVALAVGALVTAWLPQVL